MKREEGWQMNSEAKSGRVALGRRAEALIAEYLRERGHEILAQNWRYGALEIDVISWKNETLHFVEVKSEVISSHQTNLEDRVNGLKQYRITKAAQAYIRKMPKEYNVKNLEIFFDVGLVIFDKGKSSIKYIEQAYTPIY